MQGNLSLNLMAKIKFGQNVADSDRLPIVF